MSATGCTRCATPLEDGDLRCAVCALPVAVAATSIDKPRAQILRCTDCGAAIGYDANKQAPACGFCGAVMKVEQPIDPIEAAQLRLPFSVDREVANRALRTWLGRRGYFAPKSLSNEAVIETLQPLCWAAWIVNAKAQVAWTADSNHDSHRSAWAPHSGVVSIEFGNIAVPATRGLNAHEAARLVPSYDLSKVVSVGETITGEVPAMIESFDAQRSAARETVHRAIEELAKVRVKPAIPGSKVRNIRVSCMLERQTTDRVALPAWVLAYRYRGSPYRAIIHGQQADQVFGTSPRDWTKILLLVLGGLAIVAGIIALLVAHHH
ncbi:MAG: zinc ribbon domain-containing protein [Kofleriaceae bacterium]